VFFRSTTFTDAALSDSLRDIIFKENGQLANGDYRAVVIQGIDPNVPKYRYRVNFAPSGQLKATSF
jgi:hypothetical protein